MTTYRERRLARAERLAEWADKRDAKAQAAQAGVDRIADMIPFGQPILVGHHSEKRARRDQERMHNGMHAAVENSRKADSMRSRAANIEAAVDNAIYDDDPDAIERLTAKIATLEARRDEMKRRNAEYRKEHKDELKAMTAYERSQAVPYQGWPLTNLSATINATRKRLAMLERRKASTGTTAKPARGLYLRYAGKCAGCGCELAKDTFAYYDRAERTVTCKDCHEGGK